jgi:hypothetical protein
MNQRNSKRLVGTLMGLVLVVLSALAAAAASAEDFALVVLPDTQKYACDVSCGSNSQIFAAQTGWIVNNKNALNVAYVAHLGDIVEHAANALEWGRADSAMSLLENPLTTSLPDGIPYGVIRGNHDQDSMYNYYNQYFGLWRFGNRSYYGGSFDETNNNNYTLFDAGGMDFIVINLEYSPSTAVLSWADSLLKTHSDRRAIVVSHNIIGTGNPGVFSSAGQAIYNALKDNPNLFLMLCGHVHGEGRRVDVFDGNTVYTLLSDYQSYATGGNGFLRIMYFSPDRKEIRVETYSPWLDQYETDPNSRFTLSYDMGGPGTAFPDLIVQSIVVDSASPGTGQPLNVTVTVKNRGDAAADVFQVDFYRHMSSAPAPQQIGDANCFKKDGLAAGATDSCMFPVTYSTPGGYSLWAQVDTELQVVEFDETNNVFGPQTIIVGSPADLILSSLTAPATAKACQAIAITDTTANSGGYTAAASTTRFYWSTNSTYDTGDAYLGSRGISALSPGASSSGTTSVTAPCGSTPGTYYIVGRADGDKVVGETDENNNNRYVSIKIVLPDLIVSSLSTPLSAKACQAIALTDTTANSGGYTAAASTTRFYWSTNSTYDTGDAYLGSRGISALSPGASSSGSASVKVPCGKAPGTYYIVGRADADNVMGEVSETNNTRSKSITVRRW